MSNTVVLLSIPGLRAADLGSMPRLLDLTRRGETRPLTPSFPAVTCPVQVNLTTGGATLLSGFIPGRECAYDPAQDEVGCLSGSQLNSYDFAAQAPRAIAESSTIRSGTFGTVRITFNATHWFVPDASGLAAYPRAGGSPRYYPSIDTRNEAYAVDDDSAFVCIAGDIVRVSLEDETHEALTRGDCASIQGLGAVLAIDATYVYYVGASDFSNGGHPIDIRRIARTAPGSPVTPGE